MFLFELANYAGMIPQGQYDKTLSVTGVSADSEKVKKGEVFFAIKGMKKDGHDFIFDAIKKAACAVVIDKNRAKEFCGISVPCFAAENTRAAYSYALDAVNDYPSKRLKIIAVTGTNGKTSISFIVYNVLMRCKKKCGLIGTLGAFLDGERIAIENSDPAANMTTPDPSVLYPLLSLMYKKGAEYVVMEASSHASALSKLSPLPFAQAIFSNLSPEHLDFHKSMDEYLRAKLDILKKADRVILNADTEYTETITNSLKEKEIYLTSLRNNTCDYFGERIKYSDVCKTEFLLCSKDKKYNAVTNLTGEYNVENVILAVACADVLGISIADSLESVRAFTGIPGRMQTVNTECDVGFSVIIDYAHTPDALRKALIAVRKGMNGGRIILVFGCGGDRDREKRPLMAKEAEKYADIVIVTSDNSRSEEKSKIISEIVHGFNDDSCKCEITVIEERRDAVKYAVSIAQKGDVVLLAGKGHEKYEIDKNGKRPFDEEAIVKECLNEYRQNKKKDIGE